MTVAAPRPTSWNDGIVGSLDGGIMAPRSGLPNPSVNSRADSPDLTDGNTLATGKPAESRTEQPGNGATEYTDITLPSGERISGGRCEAILGLFMTHWQCTQPAKGQCHVCRNIYCDVHTLGHWQEYHTPADLYTPND